MKIPPDAFNVYAAMGEGRSYQLVADRFNVAKRSVAKRAAKENWQEKLETLEAEVAAKSKQKTVDEMTQSNERHLKTYQLIQSKALEALKSVSLRTALDAVRALDISIKGERYVRGEPEKVTTIQIEERIRIECERWVPDNTSGSARRVINAKSEVLDGAPAA